ncbi:MAG TPA: cell envelope integrity protein TolA [Pseudobdellovibrionaceae bacterium]|nr:cell envelope integrity protein TolA [Pseudobdellovibrionaceae bacterium]
MNRASHAPRKTDDVKIGLMVSLLGHVSLVAFFLVRTLVFQDAPFDSLPAIRVDMVALPDKITPQAPPAPSNPDKPEAKAPPAPPPPKQETAAPAPPSKPAPAPAKKEADTINLNKTKASQKSAIDRLKRLQALEKIENDLEKESAQNEKKRLEAMAAASRAQAGEIKLKGNQIAAGTELTGIDKLQHDEYRGVLDRHIKPFWQLPEWLARKQYTARVLIRIDARGRLISKQLLKASGNRDFDDSVLLTIDQAAPLPVPPEKFLSKVAVEGIILEFGE